MLNLVCIFGVYGLAFIVLLPGGMIGLRQRLMEASRVSFPEFTPAAQKDFPWDLGRRKNS